MQPANGESDSAQVAARPSGISRVIRSVFFALFFLVVPSALLGALFTALALHLLGVLSVQHWGLAQWLLMPARFVLFCYPLLLFGVGLLAAGLSSDEPANATIGFIAFAWGLFCGLVIGWFPDPAISEIPKAMRVCFALLLGVWFAVWGRLAAAPVGAA